MQHRNAIILMFISLLIELACLKEAVAQADRGDIRIMFNNVENAFDIFNDPLTEDDEFLPGGLMRWNQTRYSKKINSLYKTIVAAGEWSPPEIVAFCEIENRKVLEDLVYGTFISKYNYGIVHENSPDRRGIDVCLIYRKEAIKLAGYDYLVPAISDFFSRSILYARFVTDQDTLHFFVNHWPSRKGGVLATVDMRLKIAEMLKRKVDSLLERSAGKAKIIITGDFNSTPADQEIKLLLSSGAASGMINLTTAKAGSEGTYKYMGSWEMIDQMIVSEYLLESDRGLYTEKNSFSVLNKDFLMVKDPNYPGMMPFATYRGYRYQGGFSDHLPVIITLHRYPRD
jgi:endonuclease/exonuclease/phosphatase family metal-dependent hydrolase